MKGTILKVFGVLAAMVLAIAVWTVFFGGTGILASGYNAITKPVNDTWKSVVGGTATDILPQWDTAKGKAQSSSGGLGEASNVYK